MPLVPERVHVSGQHVLSGRVPRRVDRHVRGHGSPGQPRGVQGAMRQPAGMPVDRVFSRCYLLTLRPGGQRRGGHNHDCGRLEVRVHDRHEFVRGATQPLRKALPRVPSASGCACCASSTLLAAHEQLLRGGTHHHAQHGGGQFSSQRAHHSHSLRSLRRSWRHHLGHGRYRCRLAGI